MTHSETPAPEGGPGSGSSQRLVGLTVPEIGVLPQFADLPSYRSRQVATWIFARGAQSFEDMTDLPVALRRQLSQGSDLSRDPVSAKTDDPNGEATKFLFRLHDEALVESVIIHGRRRQTLCISSQVGCAYGCTFCATARMGAGRDLTAAEIVSQVLVLRDELRERGWSEGFNLVFMGMGEPLANLPNLIQSLKILQDPDGMAIGRRRITVSTVGLVPEIRELARASVAPRLAFSLVATTTQKRLELMPIEKKYPFYKVLDALAKYREQSGQRVTLEYVLLDGINDTADDAKRLARYARETGAKVNVIAYNKHPGSSHEATPKDRMASFLETLYPLANEVTVRYSRGRNIQAACGQLATETKHRTTRRAVDTKSP